MKTNKMEKMEKLLELFLDKGSMREWMREPFTNSEKNVIFATDSQAMIIINGAEANDFNIEKEKIQGIYPIQHSPLIAVFSLNDIQSTLNSIKKLKKEIAFSNFIFYASTFRVIK